MAIPTPGGIGIGESAGAVAFVDPMLSALAGTPPVRGRAGFDTGAVAGNGHNRRNKAQLNGALYADLSEYLLEQAFRTVIEPSAF